MPKCQKCGNSVKSEDLRAVGGVETLLCGGCRKPKEVEKKMAENTVYEKRQIVSLALNEVPTKDGAVDHEVSINGGYGGLDIKFNTTFDKIRAFFTQQRERGKRASLKSVK